VSLRDEVARFIMAREARYENGHIAVYKLPPGDGGGAFEVAGINDRYHPNEATKLAALIRDGQHAKAEARAVEYIAAYTDVAAGWTNVPALEAFLRDCVFNRGPGGAAKILQMALVVTVDGVVGPVTRAHLSMMDTAELLLRMRATRERYERTVARRDESSPFWKGLVARWDAALRMAQGYLNRTTEVNDEPDADPRSDGAGWGGGGDGAAADGYSAGAGDRRADVLPRSGDQGTGGREGAPAAEAVTLKEQLLAAANKHAALPRYERGYQGEIEEVLDPITVIPVRCADGRERYIEPSHKKTCFVRDRIEIGAKPGAGVSVLDFLSTAIKLGLGVLLLAFILDQPARRPAPPTQRAPVVDLRDDTPMACSVDHGWMRCPVAEERDSCER
jgi:lysozyme family protein